MPINFFLLHICLYKTYVIMSDCILYCNHINLNSSPLTDLASPAKKRKRDDSRIHATGCARTEGFYKIDVREKAKHKVRTFIMYAILTMKSSSRNCNSFSYLFLCFLCFNLTYIYCIKVCLFSAVQWTY